MTNHQKKEYMVSRDERPLTEAEKAHIKEIESQPGYKERHEAFLRRIEKQFNTDKLS